jgi:hypothetical protein
VGKTATNWKRTTDNHESWGRGWKRITGRVSAPDHQHRFGSTSMRSFFLPAASIAPGQNAYGAGELKAIGDRPGCITGQDLRKRGRSHLDCSLTMTGYLIETRVEHHFFFYYFFTQFDRYNMTGMFRIKLKARDFRVLVVDEMYVGCRGRKGIPRDLSDSRWVRPSSASDYQDCFKFRAASIFYSTRSNQAQHAVG